MNRIESNSPIRTCVVCRRQFGKNELQRYVWESASEKELLDIAQKLPGRGVYCCSQEACTTRFVKRKYSWKRAFRLKS